MLRRFAVLLLLAPVPLCAALPPAQPPAHSDPQTPARTDPAAGHPAASAGSRADLARMAGCTLQGRQYTCAPADLSRALSLSSTISCVSAPANHASDAVLADLVRRLGKSVASPTVTSDLTFILEPLQQAGVQVGPGTVELARLRVLLTSPTGAPGKLLWVQTFSGDPSMPWPAIARATADALRDQLRSR